VTKPDTVDDYLGALPADRRVRIESVLAILRAEAPEAEELISYDMPSYKVGGQYLASIGAFKRHDSLFPASADVVAAVGDDVAPFVRGRGTFHFAYPADLPLELIARIVRARLEELAAR